jgi:hypothetical protein
MAICAGESPLEGEGGLNGTWCDQSCNSCISIVNMKCDACCLLSDVKPTGDLCEQIGAHASEDSSSDLAFSEDSSPEDIPFSVPDAVQSDVVEDCETWNPVDIGETVSPRCTRPEGACAPVECAGGTTELADIGSMQEYLDTADWPLDRPVCNPSHDFVAPASTEFDASAIKAPECDTFRQRDQPVFGMLSAPPGVTCTDPASLGEALGFCRIIQVQSGTVLRLRPHFVVLHGIKILFQPVIDILAACGTACETTEVQCADGTCWPDAKSYCAGCLGLEDPVCQCYGVEPGSACHYATGDLLLSGHCWRDRCRIGTDDQP